MTERGEGVVTPNPKARTESTEPTTAATDSRSSGTTTAFTYKLIKF